MSGHIVFWGLCAVLVFVPLPIGSVEEWAIFVFEAATLALFLVYIGGALLGRRKRVPRGAAGDRDGLGDVSASESAEGTAPAAFPLIFKSLLGIFVLVSFLQIVPLPAGVVKVLSPRAYDIYLGLAGNGITGPASWLTLSLAPSATLSELILILCYGIFGFLVLRTVRSRRRVEIFVLVMIASALFQSIYGMTEVFSGHETIFGRVKRYNLGSVTGTYVNRNHFAGFLEMIFPLSLGYLLVKARYFAMEKGMSLRRKVLWFGQESLQWTLLLALAPVFIGVGLVFSKSRSGIMVLVVTVLLAAAAVASWREFSEEDGEGPGRGTKRRAGRIVRLVFTVVLAAAVWLGVGPVIERFGEMDITKEARQTFYKNTVELIGDFPWAGTGKGTYVNAYDMYEKVDDQLTLSFAHNDYLEFAAENGVVGGGALVLAGVGLAVWLAMMWRRRRSSFAKGIGLGALLGVTALLIHGFTDFNLQIPANAIFFTALTMLGVSVLNKTKNGKNGDMSPNKFPYKLPIAGLLAVALFVPAYNDFRGFQHLERYRTARSEARNVESAFAGLESRLERAVSASPRAVFEVELARLYLEMARVANDSGREEERDALCDKAVATYSKAIAADPIDAGTLYETGTAYLLYNFPLMTYQDRANAYFREALELKPADEFLNLNIIFLNFTWWETLEDADKARAAALFRAQTSRDPGFVAKLESRWTRSFKTPDRLRAILAELPRLQ